MNETGDDLDGILLIVLVMYCMGAVQKYIFFNPTQVLSSAECKAVGRILIHGFFLTGFLPLSMNHALLFYLASSVEPSDNLLMMAFLSFLSRE